MAKILCTGIATVDIINELEIYPNEDEEVRILSQTITRGGNASNTAVVLSKLNHQCFWAGTCVDPQFGDKDSHILINDLQQHRIELDYVQFTAQGKVPTSYISLSRLSGSRTICHYRDLPEFPFEAFKNIPLKDFDWFHFEGRNIKHTAKMMQLCSEKSPNTPISLEIEKNRSDIESLISSASLILFSKDYAKSLGYTDARSFCQDKSREHPKQLIFCAWGKSGAGAAFKQNFYWQDGFKVKTINSLGAGDVFNAAIIHQQLKQASIPASLFLGCRLAADKCAKKELIP